VPARLEPNITTAVSVTSPQVFASHRGVGYTERGRHDHNPIGAVTGYK
jgi:hypothetical protein